MLDRAESSHTMVAHMANMKTKQTLWVPLTVSLLHKLEIGIHGESGNSGLGGGDKKPAVTNGIRAWWIHCGTGARGEQTFH